jgi:hypothetical protein
MQLVLVVLIALIAATPAVLVSGGALFLGLLGVAAAAALVVVALTLREGESEHLRRSFRPVAIAAVFPALWMLVQALPLRSLAWVHPVWQSAESAFGDPVLGSLSVDRGLTLLALYHYLFAVAITFLAAAVAVDRRRARWLLVALTGATTVIAIVIVAQHFGGTRLFSRLERADVYAAAIDCVVIGAILAVAAVIGAIDLQQKRQSGPAKQGVPVRALAASLAALAICTLTLIFFGTVHALVAMTFGLATFFAIVASRHVGIGPWGGAGIATIIVAAFVVMIVMQPRVLTLDLTLAFASTTGPQSPISITQRILSDANWAGSGAGTYGALVPIYKDFDDAFIETTAPTAAAAMAVELGRAALWIIVAVVVAAVLALVRGALLRGRDAFYPAAGAGCLVTATFLGFSGAGMLNAATSIVLAATVGLGFTQSKSRILS